MAVTKWLTPHVISGKIVHCVPGLVGCEAGRRAPQQATTSRDDLARKIRNKEHRLPTISQLVRKGRSKKAKKSKAPALQFSYNALQNRRTSGRAAPYH